MKFSTEIVNAAASVTGVGWFLSSYDKSWEASIAEQEAPAPHLSPVFSLAGYDRDDRNQEANYKETMNL